MATAKRADWETGVVPSSIGSVTGRTTKTFTFQVDIDPMDSYAHDNADEFILMVNGKIVTRMNEYRARRMGLIQLCGYSQLI